MGERPWLIGYYRLSAEDGPDEESNSIKNQRLLIQDYISNRPDLAEMPFREFYDDGYSGATMERPGIRQVLQLARENKVQCIIVKDFSRFSRDYIQMGTCLEQVFPFLGVRFISISDGYDSKDYKGRTSDITVQFKGLIADFYVKDQSVKVKSAIEARRKKGEYCCSLAPYGYEKSPDSKGGLRIVEEEAAVIRRIFDLTNERYSKNEICWKLNEEKIPTPLQSMRKGQKAGKKAEKKGLQWTPDMIRKILDDKNYIGYMVYGKTKVLDPGTGKEASVPRDQWKVMEDHHSPIVPKEIFEEAQRRQRRYIRKHRCDNRDSLLRGYLKCGNCKRNLKGSRDLHGHILYSCPYSQGKNDAGCFAGKADNKILEYAVLAELKRQLQQNMAIGQMDKAMRKKRQDLISAYQKEIGECEERQRQLKQQRRHDYERYRSGELRPDQFLDEKEKIKASEGQLQRRVKKLEEVIQREEEILMKKNIPIEEMIAYAGYEKLTREMVEKYVKEIYVHDDGRIEIIWKTFR